MSVGLEGPQRIGQFGSRLCDIDGRQCFAHLGTGPEQPERISVDLFIGPNSNLEVLRGIDEHLDSLYRGFTGLGHGKRLWGVLGVPEPWRVRVPPMVKVPVQVPRVVGIAPGQAALTAAWKLPPAWQFTVVGGWWPTQAPHRR